MLDADNTILYIGKAKNLKKRLSSYFRTTLPPKTRALMARTNDIQTIISDSESEALILENNLIKKYLPRYNILLRDDKSYPFIYLSKSDFPRLSFYRGAQKKAGKYFGPYPSSNAVKQSLNILQKIFHLRSCENSFFKHRSRPCLQYQIKRCHAPCVKLISQEAYSVDIKHAVLFLQGKSAQVANIMEKKMYLAAEEQNYEEAAKFRDQIKNLRQVQDRQLLGGKIKDIDIVALAVSENIAVAQVMVFRDGNNLGGRSYNFRNIKEDKPADILSAFISQHYLNQPLPGEIITNYDFDNRSWLEQSLSEICGHKVTMKTKVRGERAKWLKLAITNAQISLGEKLNMQDNVLKRMEALQEIFSLDKLPRHIECFDISHTAGEATVASCVVFKNGVPAKEYYRKFNIKDITGADDYAAMRQAIKRRYTRVIKENLNRPDLLLVDGGKGQLTQALEIMQELQLEDVPLIGIAKGEGRKSGWETLFFGADYTPFKIEQHNPGFHLVQYIRDEAHRFAISAHRAKRAKTRKTSTLEAIPGIGAKRRKALLNHFGGLAEVKNAALRDIARVKRISVRQAGEIYDYFH